MDCSSSLKELLSKLCLESNKKYKIDSTDVTQSGGDSKLRQLSLVIYFMDTLGMTFGKVIIKSPSQKAPLKVSILFLTKIFRIPTRL